MGNKWDVSIKTKCAYCGKEFSKRSDQWAYRYKKKYMCSHSCLQQYKKDLADKDRHKIFIARNRCRENNIILRIISCKDNEAHTLEEWAQIYSIDYYKLWEAQDCYHMSIIDAICALQPSIFSYDPQTIKSLKKS